VKTLKHFTSGDVVIIPTSQGDIEARLCRRGCKWWRLLEVDGRQEWWQTSTPCWRKDGETVHALD
jgi:hypothetical protein